MPTKDNVMLTTMNVGCTCVWSTRAIQSPAILSSFSWINAVHTIIMFYIRVPIISIISLNETNDTFETNNSEIIWTKRSSFSR